MTSKDMISKDMISKDMISKDMTTKDMTSKMQEERHKIDGNERVEGNFFNDSKVDFVHHLLFLEMRNSVVQIHEHDCFSSVVYHLNDRVF